MFTIQSSCVYGVNQEQVKSCSIENLIQKTTDLFGQVGFTDCDSTMGMIEYWRYTNMISSRDHVHLDVHTDDYAVVSFPVYTAIYYVTNTSMGGHLLIHDDHLNVIHDLDITPPHDRVRVVLLHGSVPHSVGNILSDGMRECIVVQLKRLI
jgi:hypothetical protein